MGSRMSLTQGSVRRNSCTAGPERVDERRDVFGVVELRADRQLPRKFVGCRGGVDLVLDRNVGGDVVLGVSDGGIKVGQRAGLRGEVKQDLISRCFGFSAMSFWVA